MTSDQPDIPDTSPATKLLSELVIELNIARRNFRSYPKGHPVIEASLNKVLAAYEKMFSRQVEILLGVARDTLLINETALDKKNLVFRDFAKVLYELGIGALVLHHGLKINELRNFNVILNLKREDVLKHGGIAVIWEKSGISAIGIKPIRYDLFSTTEQDSVSGMDSPPPGGLWETFVRGLMQGTLSSAGSEGSGILTAALGDDDDIDPELLASLLNKHREAISQASEVSFSNALDSLDQDRLSQSLTIDTDTAVSYDKLALFINKLDPDLRRQFMSSSFVVQSLTGSTGSIAEEIVPRLSPEAVAGTMDDISHNRYNVPPVIIKLIQQLSLHAADHPLAAAVEHEEETGLNQRIRAVFCEHPSENYIPESYQAVLDRIATTDLTSRIEKGVIADLLMTVDPHVLENHISDIILSMMALLEHDEEQIAILIENMNDFYAYLLETGEYEQIIQLIDQCDSPEIPAAIRERLRQNYTSREYLDEMLVGLTNWGKSRYDDVTSLITSIGPAFIEVLLDRLALEENLSLRRFYMDRIQEFGSLARDAIIARLRDNRWFVLRNLIIMLRLLDDSTVLEHVRPLINHANQRVRMEALRTCLHFQDPSAERQILYDLASSDRETQMAAIYMADKSRSLDVFRRLLSFLGRGGLSALECELKSAVIQILAEIGRPEALPELAKLLSSRSLLYGRQLNKLKVDIIRSLRHYPADVARPILQRLSGEGGEIGAQATATLKSMSEKPR